MIEAPAAVEGQIHTRLAAPRSLPTDLGVLLTTGAASVHAFTIPGHLRSWPASGVFFGMLAVAQIALAVALFRNRFGDRLVRAALWGTVGVVLVYLVSRTVGLPFAPGVSTHGASLDPGRAIIPGAERRVGYLDLFTLVFEVLSILVFTGLLSAPARRRAVNGLMVAGVTLWGLAFAGVLS